MKIDKSGENLLKWQYQKGVDNVVESGKNVRTCMYVCGINWLKALQISFYLVIHRLTCTPDNDDPLWFALQKTQIKIEVNNPRDVSEGYLYQ